MGFMWSKALVMAVMLCWLVFRMSFTVRSVRARRAGDADRADLLTQRGVKISLATGCVVIIAFFVVVAFVAH